MVAIIVSKQDVAGLNIKKRLLELKSFEETGELLASEPIFEWSKFRIYTIAHEAIYAQDLDLQIHDDIFVFATKHQSSRGVKSLTVHSFGNFGEAEMGGASKQLGIAPAGYIKAAFQKLVRLAEGTRYEVAQEATHHGPFLMRPGLFIEVGSTPEQWGVPEGGKIVAQTILDVFSKHPPTVEAAFGIGGPHYAPNFKRIMLESDLSVAHICSKYSLGFLDEAMIRQVIDRSIPMISKAVLDYKGLGDKKAAVVKALEVAELEWIKTSDI